MSIIKYVLYSLLVLASISGFSQETRQVSNARGAAIITGRISESEARREALRQAKVEALRLAGVSENLSAYEMLFRSETDMDYSEFFTSDIQSEMQGAVSHYEIVEKKRSVDPVSGLFQVEKAIQATVVLYDIKPDPEFSVRVDGVKGIYENGETLTFQVRPTMDSYLHIFNITDNEAYLMYPNPWEERRKLSGGQTIAFPFGYVDYYLEKQGNQPEANRLIFVLTKQNVAFNNYLGEEQYAKAEDIFAWIYTLSPDIRTVDYQTFTIR